MCLHSLFCICMSHFPRTICWRDYFFSTILPLLLSNFHWLWVKVACSCLTFCNPMDCRPQAPLSMGILQARIQEEIAIPSSIGCFWPRDWTQVSCISGRLFTNWVTREAHWLSLTISGPISGYSILFHWFVYSFMPIQYCTNYCCSLNHVWPFVTPWTAEHQALLSFTLSQFAQTHVHWVSDAIQPSHPQSSPSPPSLNYCLQSFPTSGSFSVSWLFTSAGQSIGASPSASVLPMNI